MGYVSSAGFAACFTGEDNEIQKKFNFLRTAVTSSAS